MINDQSIEISHYNMHLIGESARPVGEGTRMTNDNPRLSS